MIHNQEYIYFLSVGFERANFKESWLYNQLDKGLVIKTDVPIKHLVKIYNKLNNPDWLREAILFKNSRNIKLIKEHFPEEKYPEYYEEIKLTSNEKKFHLRRNLELKKLEQIIEIFESDIELYKLGENIYLINTYKLFKDNKSYKSEYVFFLAYLLIDLYDIDMSNNKFRFIIHDKEINKEGDNYFSEISRINDIYKNHTKDTKFNLKGEVLTFMHDRNSSRVYKKLTCKDREDYSINKFEKTLNQLFNFNRERLSVYHFLCESLNQYRMRNDNKLLDLKTFIDEKIDSLSDDIKQKCCKTYEFEEIQKEIFRTSEDDLNKAYELISKQIDQLI